jgi:hypothetical protein
MARKARRDAFFDSPTVLSPRRDSILLVLPLVPYTLAVKSDSPTIENF